MMSWPNDLSSIRSNMNTTELWALKEQIENSDWSMENMSSFVGYTSWDWIVHGTTYKFTEFYEQITEIKRR